jgi:hypothetical protein
MNRKRPSPKRCLLAALTVGTCYTLGAGCIQAILASIGVTFF